LDIILKIWAPLRKHFAPLGVPSWLLAWLKLRTDCLSLNIVLLNKNIQPYENDRQELCVIQKTRGKLQLRCSKCWLIENCGPKSVWS